MSSSGFNSEPPKKQGSFGPDSELLRLTPEEERQELQINAMHQLAGQMNAGQPSLPPGQLPAYLQGAVFLSPVRVWAGSGRVGRVKQALLDGADVNEPDEQGMTPLFYAVRQGDQSIVQLLLQCGADAMVKAPSGETPVDLAKAKATNNLIELMMTYGADPQAVRNLLSAPPVDETQWKQYNDLARRAYEQEKYIDAEQLLLAALQEAERFGPFDVRLGETLRGLGYLYLHLERHEEAMPLFHRFAIIRESASSKCDDVGVATALALAECAFRLGMYNKVIGYGYTVLFSGGLNDTPVRTTNLPSYERILDLMKRSVELGTDLGHTKDTIEEFRARLAGAR